MKCRCGHCVGLKRSVALSKKPAEERRPNPRNVEALCEGTTVLDALKVERLAACLILHQRGESARRIGDMLQVIDRSVYRYLRELKEMGLL
jgi:hypothetical protein